MDSTNGPVTSQITEFIARLTLADVPSSIRETALLVILDVLGCLRGGSLTSLAPKIKAVSSVFGGPGQASCAGKAGAVGSSQALYVNSRLANILDLDETWPIGCHHGIGVVCSAIAALETRINEGQSCSGSDLILGVVAGYEVASRLATAIGPIVRVRDGKIQDYAKVWGVAAPVVVGSCVAFMKTLNPTNADTSMISHALAIAVSNIPLPIGNRWSDDLEVADCKYDDAGWCSITGMHGVLSAMEGLTGFANIFDGDVGIAEACGSEMARKESLTEDLGKLWYMADVTFKPWPTCRWIQGPQTAFRRLLEKHHPKLEDVEEVVMFTNPVADGLLFRNPAPTTFCGYSFSYSCAATAMLMKIPPGHKWFDPEIVESETALNLRKRVRVERMQGSEHFAKDMVRNEVRTLPGAVSLRTKQGQVFTEKTSFSDGDPWDPSTRYDRAKVVDKFLVTVGSSDAQTLVDWIMNLENAINFEPLSAFIQNDKERIKS
ncbi:unnamed protein product [Clonostachys byssicola]|uniref:MmgE/PrpD family protein n=1 Tax=Clonostachys byssicola TaxID=160290 RepID=A0A9N9Y714_9HYPO|nr:unnamed protein product [Clonostachys byssicola]